MHLCERDFPVIIVPSWIAIMKDIKSHKLICFKGSLFLALGLASALLLLAEVATAKAALLLAICIWGFCRAYYFAFYVIEHYVDPRYRFSGLFSFAQYLIRRNYR